MIKVKQHRTADCVVGGFRYAEKKQEVGSLLLGLYDDAGLLHHVGFTSVDRGEGSPSSDGRTGRPGQASPASPVTRPGGPSRWSTGRSANGSR